MSWPEIWYGRTPLAVLARAALAPASWLYALGWSCYRAIYDLGLKKPARPFSPILVIGNLTVGGSGKTPLTVYVARELYELGCDVVVGLSGYGGPRSEGATLAPKGPLDPAEWGDEPALLRSLLPNTEMVVGRARVRAAQLVAEMPPAKRVLLMDDGFQHLPLAKSASILIDPTSSNRMCLPAGPYREPRNNLRRANLVLDGSSPFQIVKTISEVTHLHTGTPLQGVDEVDALCAIGRPEQFRKALNDLGLSVRRLVALPDHDRLDHVDWRTLDGPIIVTAKDAVKLQGRPDLPRGIFIAHQTAIVEPRDAFRAKLVELVCRE